MTTPITLELTDEAATERLGETLATVLTAGDFVGLVGDLGAGKTCLTRGILRAVAGDDLRVTSPTYTLLNEYEGPAPYPLIVHADLYRLHDEDDLESTGYWDAVADADLLIVEWIDHVEGARPAEGWRVHLEHVAGGRCATVVREGKDAAQRTEELRARLRDFSR